MNELFHYGVKGMKWGVRNKQELNIVDNKNKFIEEVPEKKPGKELGKMISNPLYFVKKSGEDVNKIIKESTTDFKNGYRALNPLSYKGLNDIEVKERALKGAKALMAITGVTAHMSVAKIAVGHIQSGSDYIKNHKFK